jgi:hypothetical protein
MGDLLAFPHEDQRPKRRAGLARNDSAEILIFTGVRYERHVDIPPIPTVLAGGDDTRSPDDGLPPGASPHRRRAR